MTSLKPGDDEVLADRYVELCEMAKCSPDTPDHFAFGDTRTWLQQRLRDYGHDIRLAEVYRCRKAWLARRAATASVHVATFTAGTATEEGRTDEQARLAGRTGRARHPLPAPRRPRRHLVPYRGHRHGRLRAGRRVCASQESPCGTPTATAALIIR